MFPFPPTTGTNAEEKVAEIINYLIQFKETLEFALTNISSENLSPDLLKRLNELGANIEKSDSNREEEIIQISNNSITVSDVINSDLFKAEIKNEVGNITIGKITFSVNYDTGHLEFTIQKEGE